MRTTSRSGALSAARYVPMFCTPVSGSRVMTLVAVSVGALSTPGFDSAPTLTATNVITRDPDTGVQNMGTYRAALKASDRLVVRMATRVGGAGGYQHYLKYQKRGEPMPCAIMLG